MTNPPNHHASLAIPISALLAPQPPRSQPHDLLPSPSVAILGPLPPTSALHLVLNYIALSDLPDYEHGHAGGSSSKEGANAAERHRDASNPVNPASISKKNAPARALIITGNKDALYHALQDEDEDWMREHAGEYGVMSRLKRCDIRYCSTPQQLTLLLAMLTSEKSTGGDDATYNLFPPPGLIILYDIASLFMHWEGGDENAHHTDAEGMDLDGHSQPGVQSAVEPRMVFNDDIILSTYLDAISAARDAVAHLSHGHHAAQLVILEPNISDTSTLPIMPKIRNSAPTTPFANVQDISSHAPDVDRLGLPSQSRSKRITVTGGLSWLLGSGNVGVVRADDSPPNDNRAAGAEHSQGYIMSFPDSIVLDNAPYALHRRRCQQGEWANRVGWHEEQAECAGVTRGWRWTWG